MGSNQGGHLVPHGGVFPLISKEGFEGVGAPVLFESRRHCPTCPETSQGHQSLLPVAAGLGGKACPREPGSCPWSASGSRRQEWHLEFSGQCFSVCLFSF